jgi:large subunit ribosomal protein L19
MNKQAILALVEKSSLKPEPPQFKVGDEVDVHTRILEGEKERIQIFNGTVIARSGSGSREMFTVRRIVQGEGVERKFPLNSPKIANIVVKRSSVVRRAKLYFLRDRVGKAVKLRERREEQQEAATSEKRRAPKPAGAKKRISKEPVAAGK